jgi:hypothetical protein
LNQQRFIGTGKWYTTFEQWEQITLCVDYPDYNTAASRGIAWQHEAGGHSSISIDGTTQTLIGFLGHLIPERHDGPTVPR